MALAPRVLDKDDLARADAARLAVARGNLDARIEIDDVLSPRGRMLVVTETIRSAVLAYLFPR